MEIPKPKVWNWKNERQKKRKLEITKYVLNERQATKKSFCSFLRPFWHPPPHPLTSFSLLPRSVKSIIISVVLFWCSHSRRKWETIPHGWPGNTARFFFHLNHFFFLSFLVWNHCSENYSRRFLPQ